MTKEAQRICIAEACGWTWCEHSGDKFSADDRAYWYPPGGVTIPPFREPQGMAHRSQLPRYESDLNAIHEAEKVVLLDPFETAANDVMETAMALAERVHAYQNRLFDLQIGLPRAICHFTAAQRAESLLRAIGQWKEQA